MARKKKDDNNSDSLKARLTDSNAKDMPAIDQPITDMLEINYMPYAMSVIVSRAIPEIDGFKPSHRKLLYTMYKMGLLGGNRTKSANVVGQTMKLNPHGDQAIYDTMVRLTRGNGSLLHPFVDSKGNFGKQYSRDMQCAAPRYTEVRLEKICEEIFKGIDKDAVDMVDNYDGTLKEPTLLPTTFPAVLVNANQGIAVGMASNICSFNLAEVCAATEAYMKDPNCDLLEVMPAPDFSGGGKILYSREQMKSIYDTGKGTFSVRARYRVDKSNNLIEITEIPYSTSVEAIIDNIADLVKSGKAREIADIRDETDLDGLKITIDCKRGTDHEQLMTKLFRFTKLEDTFSCNFNILIDGSPKVMGVAQILDEWLKWRRVCVCRELAFNLGKMKKKLHLLNGLAEILLDIDKAIKIIRETELEADVVPNLMKGFSIDEEQAEYVAEIKLRNINKQYILRRIEEVDQLRKDIEEMEDILRDKKKIRRIIVNELREVVKNYAQPRRTMFFYQSDIEEEEEADDTPDYPVNIFVSASGYFKKITPQSLRMSGEQKLKEGDYISQSFETTNKTDLIFFSDKAQAYKSKASAFDDTKASVMGDYIPAKLSFDEGENLMTLVPTTDYSGYIVFFFENGKAAKIPLKSYETKTNRKKLANAYSDKSRLVAAVFVGDDCDILLRSSSGHALVFNSGMILPKTTRDSQGVQVINLRKNAVLAAAETVAPEALEELEKYRTKSVPAAGKPAKDLGDTNQLTL